MKTVTLIRKPSDSKQTLGKLYATGFECFTLELADKDNQHNISCIPYGSYICKWTRSSRMSAHADADVFTYEVLGVPDRAGIRIHSANFFHELLGCIALGDGEMDINNDNELDMINSRHTVKAFNEFMKKEDFELVIANEVSA